MTLRPAVTSDRHDSMRTRRSGILRATASRSRCLRSSPPARRRAESTLRVPLGDGGKPPVGADGDRTIQLEHRQQQRRHQRTTAPQTQSATLATAFRFENQIFGRRVCELDLKKEHRRSANRFEPHVSGGSAASLKMNTSRTTIRNGVARPFRHRRDVRQ